MLAWENWDEVLGSRTWCLPAEHRSVAPLIVSTKWCFHHKYTEDDDFLCRWPSTVFLLCESLTNHLHLQPYPPPSSYDLSALHWFLLFLWPTWFIKEIVGVLRRVLKRNYADPVTFSLFWLLFFSMLLPLLFQRAYSRCRKNSPLNQW